ncbi:hypothetical protein HYT91_00245 [Candidatus Pacearchaeota archaeon]|nr:hypothetical protein [Candidatus Pacearchaeota archaeon]
MRASGGDCKGISDPMKRLECYEGATQYVQEFRNDFQSQFKDTQTLQNNCARDCGAKGSAWDFSNGNCVCKAPNFQEFEQRHIDNFRQDFNQDYSQQFRGDFQSGQFIPPANFQPPQGFQYPQYPTDQQQYQQPGTFQQPPEGYTAPTDYQQPSTTTTTEPSTSTTTSSEPSSSTSTDSGGSTGDSGGSITGGVISNSGFLRYWFFG